MKPKIKVYDAMMGSGKTTKIIENIKNSPMTQKYMFITPLLSECHRIAGTVTDPEDIYQRPIIVESDDSSILYQYNETVDTPLKDRVFKHPYFSKAGGKAESLPVLLNNNDNIVSTHQLFVNLTPTILQQAKDYILVVDEMLSVYEIYDVYSEKEIKAMFDNGWISLDPKDNITLIFQRENYGDNTNGRDTTKDTYYETFATLCDLGQLMLIDGKVVIWELAVNALKAFKEVWVATYMFEDNIMAAYLKAHGLNYELIRFGSKPSDIKHLINIYEDSSKSKLNLIGNKDSALSATNCKQTIVKDTLSANLDNYFRNKVKSKKSEILWTCYKESKSRVQKNGAYNYSAEWLPMNTKATNDYGDKHTVAYLINLYPNPELVKASSARGFSVKEDVYAIAEMVQFIWRSAIRNNEPINLYIPSKRMRTFLNNWLDDKYEIKPETA